MLEQRPLMFSGPFSSSSSPESQWSYMTLHRLDVDITTGKRPMDFGSEEDPEQRERKYARHSYETFDEGDSSPDRSSCLSQAGDSPEHLAEQGQAGDYLEESSHQHQVAEPPEHSADQGHADDDLEESSHQHQAVESPEHSADQGHADDYIEQSSDQHAAEESPKHYADQGQAGDFLKQSSYQDEAEDSTEHYADEDQAGDGLAQSNNLYKAGDSVEHSAVQGQAGDHLEQSSNQNQAGDSADSHSLIHSIGRDNSISCLIRCSRSDYGSIALLNRNFRSLIRSGEIYRLRRQYGMIEHWIYFSCHLLKWEAFDPIRCRWMSLPQMTSNECFMCSDKESLAVGTEILVFGKDLTAHLIYRYSLLTNSWSSGMRMNAPRCLFGSASLGEIAIIAGGCDSQGNILSSAELYNSETQSWTVLPSMNKPRKMCSGVFMDGKFYVIGGTGGSDGKVLACGEVYDLETKTWTEIPNMSPSRNSREADMRTATEAPPLVAVVNNELYAADYADMEVRKYDKEGREWYTVGRLPERAASMYGWGLAFRACGDRLIVIGGPKAGEGCFIEINSWVPSEGPPQWNRLGRKQSANFVYNCAVMGC